MMGARQVDQAALFYEFSLERHVPTGHLLRSIDHFVDLSEVRGHLAPFYSSTGRPSIDPELLVRMLLVGYCYGIRSERRLCEEVHLNLAYRWFCRLGLDGEVPDHSTASAIAICCASCSRPWSDCAWQKGWFMGRPLLSMPALLLPTPTSSALLPGLMMSTGRPLPGRADPSGNILIPWMRLPGAQPARRSRSSSPGRIRPRNGLALTKGMPSLPTPITT